jgi:hypothetical protein
LLLRLLAVWVVDLIPILARMLIAKHFFMTCKPSKEMSLRYQRIHDEFLLQLMYMLAGLGSGYKATATMVEEE